MSLMQGTTVLKMIMGLSEMVSVSTFVCAGSLYTENELEKCLILVFTLFSHLSCSVCMKVG